MQLPEQSLALLLGLATSAPAGPLTSYLATISRNIPGGFLGKTVQKISHGVTKLCKRGMQSTPFSTEVSLIMLLGSQGASMGLKSFRSE